MIIQSLRLVYVDSGGAVTSCTSQYSWTPNVTMAEPMSTSSPSEAAAAAAAAAPTVRTANAG